jgi:hypothetical protein
LMIMKFTTETTPSKYKGGKAKTAEKL